MSKLNPKIIQYLSDKLEITKGTVAKNISLLKRSYPQCTSNGVAHIYALQNSLSVLNKLNAEDKINLPYLKIEKATVIKQKNKKPAKEKIVPLIEYETTDHFVKGHIKEINRAYHYKCYTSVFVLFRKIIENFIIEILKTKYSPTSQTNRDLYYDAPNKRFKDFNIVLNVLHSKKSDFGIGTDKIIDRFYNKAVIFKNEANLKTHSLYHLVEDQKEITNSNFQALLALIKQIK